MIPIILGLIKRPLVPLVGLGVVGAGGYYLVKNFNPFAMFGKLTGGITDGISNVYKTGAKGVFGAGKATKRGVKRVGRSAFSAGKKSTRLAKKYNAFSVGKRAVKSPQAKKAARSTRKQTKKVAKKATKSGKKALKRLKRFKKW